MALRGGGNNDSVILLSVDEEKIARSVTEALKSSADDVGEAVSRIVSSIKGSLNKELDFKDLFLDADELGDRIREALSEFGRDKNSEEWAKSLIKYYNILSARSADAAENMKASYSDLASLLAKAQNMSPSANSLYDVGELKNILEGFALLKSYRFDNIIELFDVIRKNESELARLSDEVERVQSNLADAQYEKAKLETELEDLRTKTNAKEFKHLTERAQEEFQAFLVANNIDPSEFTKYGQFSQYFNDIVSGAKTSGEAIAEFKTECKDMLPKEAAANIEPFIARMEGFMRSVGEMREEIRGLSSGDGLAPVSANASAGAEAIEREGKAVRGLVEQKPELEELTSLLVAILKAGSEAGSDASQLTAELKPLTDSIEELSSIDTEKLKSLSMIIGGLSNINGFKFSTAQANNLTDFLSKLSTSGDLSSLRTLSGVSLKGFSDLSIKETSLKNLATYLPIISHVDVENLEKLQHIDLSNFADLKVPKIDTEAISGLGRLSEAMETVKEAAVTLSSAIGSTGTSVAGGIRKLTNAGMSHQQILGELQSGIGHAGASRARTAAMKLGFTNEDAKELAETLESTYALITKLDVHWKDFEDGVRTVDWVGVKGKSAEGIDIEEKLHYIRAINEEGEKYWRIQREGRAHYEASKQDTDVDADKYEALKKEIAAEEEAEAKRQENLKKFEEAEERKRQASQMTAEQAEKELTRLQSLRIDYQNQIDRADEFGVTTDTVSSLRDEISGIDNAIPVLEKIASKESDMTLGMDEYKDSIVRVKDQLTLLKKQLTSEIKSSGAFTPMTNAQYGVATNTISTKRTSLEKEIDKATEVGLGNTEQVNRLKELIPLYNQLEEQVKANAISQAQYTERMQLFRAITSDINSTLTDDIKNIDALGDQYDTLAQSIAGAQGAINGAWAEATTEQRAELNALNTEMVTLSKAWQDGKISGEQLETVLDGISNSYNKLDESVKREYATRKKSHDTRMKELSTQINANSEIGKATKLLKDYSAAEHSHNESSREAYRQIVSVRDGLSELVGAYERGGIELPQFEEAVKNYTKELEKNDAIIRKNGDDHMTAFGKIGRAIKTHLTTLTATASIGSIMRYIRQMVDAVREIDTAMTELRKVTDETDTRYEQFLDNAAVRAKNLSATISDTISATADFARLGLSIDQAEKAADAAIVYKSVGDDINSIGDAAESIISTMKAFGIEANDAMSIVDKFNKVGNEFAIGSSGVGEALKRSAAAMYTANNTLEETIGLATAANTILQNPQSVGTTLKTVSMYIRAAKTELEEAGEDTEGIAESTGKLRELIKQITAEGGKAIDIMADDNQFKSTYQILEEISKVWDKISDTNQAALLEKLGGKRNANAIAAILENFDIARQAMEAATNAEGSAMAELEKYQESIEGHIVALKTAFQELSRTVVGVDIVKTVIDFGKYALNAITAVMKLANAFGGLRTVLIMLSGRVLINVINAFKLAASDAKDLDSVLASLIRRFMDFQKSGEGAGDALKGMLGYFKTLPGVITLVTAAISAAVAIYTKLKQAERERRDAAIEAGRAADAESKEIIELYDKYTDLNEKIKEDDSLKGDLEDTTESLLKKLGIEKDKVDELADSYGGLSEAIANATMDQLKENQIDLVDAYQAAVKDLQDAVLNPNNISIAKGLIGNTDLNAIKRLVSEGLIDKFEESTSNGGAIGGYSQYHLIGSDNLKTPEGIYDAYERLTQILIKLEGTSGVSQRLIDVVKRERNQIEDKAIAYKEAADALNDNLIQQGIIDSRNIEDLADIRYHIINVVGANRVYAGSIEDVIASVDELLKKDERFAEFYRTLEEGADNAASGQSKAIQRVETDFDRFKNEISKLGSALDEFQENGKISTETYQRLASGEDKDKYAGLFKISDTGIELQTDKLNDYIESLEQEYGAKMALNGATEDEIRLMMALGGTLVTVAEDHSNVVGEIEELHGYIKDMNDGTKYSYKQINDLLKKYPKLEDAIKDAGDGYRIEISAIEDLIAVKAQYIELTDRETELVKARNALNLRNNGNTAASSNIDEIFARYEEAYHKAITSREEFNRAFAEVFGYAYKSGYEEYDRYVDALIAKNRSFALTQEVMKDAIEGTTEAIEDTSDALKEVQSDLDNLTDVLNDLNEGREYGTSEIITLLNKYPALRDHIIRTANGYKIETTAVKELINAKAQLLTLSQREISVSTARASLTTSNGRTVQADNADKVFAMFRDKYGRNIASIDEYKDAYKEFMGYAAKSSVAYAQAMIDALRDSELNEMFAQDYIDQLPQLEGYDPSKEEKSSTQKEETAFERAYKEHQHLLAMDKETTEQYLNWLDGAYKASYAAGEMEIDDYYKYEEEVYEKRKELFTQSLDEMQHKIDLLSHQTGDTTEEQIALYEQMQRKVNQQANAYRARGIKDNDELIRELQNQWWQYEENIRQLRESAFNDWLNDRKFVIDQLKQDDTSSDEIVNSWKEVMSRINDEIAYYMSKGHDITSDVIQSLMKELEEAKNSITETLEEIVSKANEVVDGFENVYKTLTDAAKEYASTGYLSVDSLQSILSLGPKYLDMLTDESGQLVINEDRLQKVIAARTEEMAAETALSYAKQILLATEQDDADALRDLTQATAASSGATWDLAYATLGYAKALAQSKGMSTDFYDDAISYVTKMQSVTKTAVDSVSSYYLTLKDGYVSQAEGLETILKLTEDMIKQENSDRIKQLEDEKKAYKDIIDEKKEILRLTKEQQDHDRDMADKLKEISDLQSKIDQLALDDSREARAQRAKLEEQLLEKQKALTDSQNDYAYDAQVDALDKQYDEYEKELDKESEALKDELNSAEKLYRAAVERITDAWENDWESLKNQLISWNFEVGNTLEKDLTAAWDAATAAAKRYGDFVSAMEGVKDNTILGGSSFTPSSESVQKAVTGGASTFTNYIEKMRANSLAWFTAENQGYYASENQRLAEEYKAATGNTLNYKNGSWYQNGSSTPIYTLSRDEVGNAVVAAMKANSAAWKNASSTEQTQLARMNEMLAKRLSDFLGVPITKTPAGVWMLGNTPLYDVQKFHSGGIAGGRGSIKQNEIMALLRKGEAVLDEKRERALYKTVDFVQILSDKIGHAIDKGRLSALLEGTGASFPKSAIPVLDGGVGTMNFSPTVQVTITGAGDLDESTARKYGSIAADTVLQQLKNAFSQRGVSATGNSILK